MKTVYEILKPKFAAATVLVLIVAIAIACAPAAQPAQDTNPTITPEPTATPEIEYLTDSSGRTFASEVVQKKEGPHHSGTKPRKLCAQLPSHQGS